MPGERDYYEILGVGRSASQDEIKRAYRAKAKQYHPDRNPGDSSAEQEFKDVQQANSVLRDPKKRSEYDQFGEVGVGRWSTNPRGQRVYQWGGGSTVGAEDIEDLFSAFGGTQHASIFDQIFGGRRRGTAGRPTPQRGTHIEQGINITFEQAIYGTTIAFTLRPVDGGPGQSIDVKIPPGVRNGQKIRVKGKGQPGANGGPPGDLHLVCSVASHRYFTRQGADLHLTVPVTVAEAALGARIEVPTLDGRATVTLPPGTPSGTKLRLRGSGIKKHGVDERGDQYVVISIVPPKNPTDEQREWFEKLREQDPSDPRTDCHWWEGQTS